MLEYKINVLESLKAAGYNTTRLRKEKMLGENIIQYLRQGKMIGMDSLDKVCTMLDAQPGDIIGYVKENTQKTM